MTRHDRILSHIERDYNQPVRDPLWKHIHLSDGLMRLVDTSAFQKLSRIKQLGPSYLVYPGATHTRLNHSLGVFHIGRKMIRTILAQPECPDLSLEGVKAFLAACLLHDLGHFPFTHSLKELPLAEHEQLTGAIVTEEPFASRIRNGVGTDPEAVQAIVDETITDGTDPEIRFYRSILSGTLDPDKLDYLNRDAYFCGVPYGIQDIDFAVSRIKPTPDYRLALEKSGISAVENILFSKYLMYRAVYWHRTIRVATAMIKKALHTALREGIVSPTDLYGLDDEQFFQRFSNRSEPVFNLIRCVPDRLLHQTAVERVLHNQAPASLDTGSLDTGSLDTGSLDTERLDASSHDAANLESLDSRADIEKHIAGILNRETVASVSDEDIIIDVPERVSFEISMPVTSESGIVDFPDAGTVFTPEVIRDFTNTLRAVRVMVSRRIVSEIGTERIEKVFNSVVRLS